MHTTTIDALFHSTLAGIAHVRHGRFVRVNDAFARMDGRSPAAIAGTPSYLEPRDARRNERTYECDHVREDGERRRLLIEVVGETGDHATSDQLFIVIDLTEQYQRAAELESTRALLLQAVDSMSDGFVLFDRDDRIVLCNQVYASMLEGFGNAQSLVGVSAESLIRRQIANGQPVPAEFDGDVEAWVQSRLAHHRRADGEPHVQQLSDGRWVQSIRHRMRDGGMVVLRSDITAFKESERAARLLSQHDALTGLPNRRLLHDRLAHAMARAQRTRGIVAVILLDLDGFKPVNDRHGHKAGDEVLRVVAQRLQASVRASDTVARFGGDEFVIVVDALPAADSLAPITEKLIAAAGEPVTISTATSTARVQVGCSIGISVYPHDGNDPDALIRFADRAMYHAKQQGGGRSAFHR